MRPVFCAWLADADKKQDERIRVERKDFTEHLWNNADYQSTFLSHRNVLKLARNSALVLCTKKQELAGMRFRHFLSPSDSTIFL